MPKCGTQCWLCDLPVRFDTYQGCTHACAYCFAKRNRDITEIKRDESAQTLIKFIEGARGIDTRWVDWNIPLHIGGMSDPFQPCEKKYKYTYDCLKVLAKTKYPFVVSTKGSLVAEKEYLELLAQCNCVVQISMVCSKYDKLEEGAPTFEERLELVRKLSPVVKRVNVRVQPYMHEVFSDVMKNLKLFKEAGVYGVVFEGMKFLKKKNGLIKIGGDYCYPTEVLKKDFTALRAECHRLGLKFYSGENRLRAMGDSLTCCGIDGLEGFVPNVYNFSHILNGDAVEPTERMKQKETGGCFHAMNQKVGMHAIHKHNSFYEEMSWLYKDRKDMIESTLLPERKRT